MRKRLKALADLVPCGVKVADIGTDHAYLPIYLVGRGIAVGAVGGDVHRGPFELALQAVQEAGLAEKIDIRLGDGLTVLAPGEVEAAVIAGMGGWTIAGILENGAEVAVKLKRLILQPMTDAGALRGWLLEHGWVLAAENLVEEEGRLYEVIAADRRDEGESGPGLDPVLLEVGPKLWEHRHPLLAKHLDKLISDRERVLDQIQNSTSAGALAKAAEVREWLERLQEMRRGL